MFDCFQILPVLPLRSTHFISRFHPFCLYAQLPPETHNLDPTILPPNSTLLNLHYFELHPSDSIFSFPLSPAAPPTRLPTLPSGTPTPPITRTPTHHQNTNSDHHQNAHTPPACHHSHQQNTHQNAKSTHNKNAQVYQPKHQLQPSMPAPPTRMPAPPTRMSAPPTSICLRSVS